MLGVLRDLVTAGTGPEELADALSQRRVAAEAEMEAAGEARGLTPGQRQRLRDALDGARKFSHARDDGTGASRERRRRPGATPDRSES